MKGFTLHRVRVIASCLLLLGALTDCGYSDKCSIPAVGTAQILLFNGTGTSSTDVVAIEKILDDNHLHYYTANSCQLNGMSEAKIGRYRLMIVPGGNFIEIGNNLTLGTSKNIHNAVRHGLNYFGICAGAFFAGNSAYYNGLDLTSGVKVNFYSAENQGIHKAVVPIASSTAAPTLDQYWEDGPQFTGWGMVIGKYPDDTPAIVEGRSGNGWVILSGVHAEAPADWRRGMTFRTPVSIDNAYAGMLIRAALNKSSLPHY